MRIWHQNLIPKLCRQHLLACWREGLGAYKIITENKKGYRNHPAVKEFEYCPVALWLRLSDIRHEMLKRGYHPKEMPELTDEGSSCTLCKKPYQSLKQQKEILKQKRRTIKSCRCKI